MVASASYSNWSIKEFRAGHGSKSVTEAVDLVNYYLRTTRRDFFIALFFKNSAVALPEESTTDNTFRRLSWKKMAKTEGLVELKCDWQLRG